EPLASARRRKTGAQGKVQAVSAERARHQPSVQWVGGAPAARLGAAWPALFVLFPDRRLEVAEVQPPALPCLQVLHPDRRPLGTELRLGDDPERPVLPVVL